MFDCPHNKGFTLPELLISMAILMIIFAFAGINLLRIIPNADMSEISNTFIADTKSQQNSAMLGESISSVLVDHSVKIGEAGYTLFRGQVFVEGAAGNYTVTYPDTISVETTFPNSQITFSAITGEIRDYNPAANQVVFSGPGGIYMTVLFNKLGNVYYVNKI